MDEDGTTALTPDEHGQLQRALRRAQDEGSIVHTEWWLLTGAPGSGKTTLAELFRQREYSVIDDPGRFELQSEIAQGRPPNLVRGDYLAFQRRVLNREMSVLSQTDAAETVVLDYGIAESLAFMKAAGIPWPADFIEATTRFTFRHVFVLDPISTNDADQARIHAPAERDTLRDFIFWIYSALGHRPVKVPLMPLYERFNFIVNESTS